MKKIDLISSLRVFLLLIVVMATLSINAQEVMIYENGVLSATYTGTSYKVVFGNQVRVYKGNNIYKTYDNSSTNTVKVVFREATTGTANATLTVGSTTETSVPWVQLWEGGPKWAVFNVGANSTSEYGGYYYWGATSASGSYSSSTTDIQGTSDDTAKNLWGDNWQMPTKADFDNLFSTTYTDGGVWKTAEESGYSVAGMLFTGKGDFSSNSVFFPAAFEVNLDRDGYYWSSTPDGSYKAYTLYFNSDGPDVDGDYCDIGRSVRAILR